MPTRKNSTISGGSSSDSRYSRIPGACPPGNTIPSNSDARSPAYAAGARNSALRCLSSYAATASPLARSTRANGPNPSPLIILGSARASRPRGVAKRTPTPSRARIFQVIPASVGSKSVVGSGIRITIALLEMKQGRATGGSRALCS